MARPTITKDNFVGNIKINVNQFKEERLNDYISDFYEQYTKCVIGDEAYLLIENEDKQKWTDLMQGVSFDFEDKKYDFKGLLWSILRFIYFEFTRDYFNPTTVGKTRSEQENSTRLAAAEVNAVATSRYNDAVRHINDRLELFLEANKDLSTEITGFIDNADNTYIIQVNDTTYLYNGDTVEIGGVEYVISGLDDNVSFVIDAGSVGLSFSGDVVWHPYDMIEFRTLEFCTI